ncbi:MAG: HAD-IIA family hydrolase [Caldilinea sp.]|nr:HAD-IIA family hydrolase [Caldilinea sp.]
MGVRCDGFVFDLDGTVYLGDAALPGSVEGIAALRQRGKRVLFVSNKPLEPRTRYAAKLTRLGIPTLAEDVITSGFVLGHHLARHQPALRYYVIGEESLRDELRGHGLTVLGELEDQDPREVLAVEEIDAVVVAFDRTLDYRKLNTAYQALMRGAFFCATNGDKSCPMPGGAIPDAGGTIAALETMTGRRLQLLAGKDGAERGHADSRGVEWGEHSGGCRPDGHAPYVCDRAVERTGRSDRMSGGFVACGGVVLQTSARHPCV